MLAPDPLTLSIALVIINVWTFMLFGFDKSRAEGERWRIGESTLIWWALVGGTIGAYAGRHHFRHKTRKASFTKRLHTAAFVQAVVLAMVLGFSLGG